MKSFVLRSVAAAAVIGSAMVLSTPTLAQSVSPEVSFNVGITNDYVWRGFSQSDEDPAIQGGVDVALGNFYAGSWASSVDFGDGTEAEWDFYAGFNASTGGIDWDFGVTYYTYVSDPKDSDYNFVEFKIAASHSFDKLTIGGALHYSPDFYGADKKATFVELTGEYAVTDAWTVSGGIGQQMLDVGDDYGTWNLGASVAINEKVSVDFRYWDADVESPLSDPRAAITLGIAF